MSQTMQTDGGNVDGRIEKVETIKINFETFKKTLKRNHLEDPTRFTDRSFVLRLCPPFKAEMEADYYESFKGEHYSNDWSEKPLHISPELLIYEGNGGKFRDIVQWETPSTVRQYLTEDEIEEAGGMEAVLEEGREMFWDELKHILPEKFNLGLVDGYSSSVVDIEWEFDD